MTAHIEAKIEDIAKTVIMPGDPKRAEFMANKFLQDVKCINQVRGMLGFTGLYKGKPVTIMASGMGNASMGIYAYELFKFYDVDNIIRVGSFGAYDKDINIYDVMIARDSYSDSSFAKVQGRCMAGVMRATPSLVKKLSEKASELEIDVKVGRVYTSDVFYSDYINHKLMHSAYNCLGTEMECFSLFYLARLLNKNASALLTASNHFLTGEETTSEEREKKLDVMFKIALEVAVDD